MAAPGLAFALPLTVAAAVVGPPKLPPMPGQGSGEPGPPPTTAEGGAGGPQPSRPKPKAPAKPKAPPSGGEPSAAPHDAAADPGGSEPAPAPEEGAFSVPERAEPPQPKFDGPPASSDTKDAPRKKKKVEGPAAAPSMEPGVIDGESEAPVLRFPPPPRPRDKGTGLFIGAGVTFAVALAEQIVAHVLVKRRCIDPIANGGVQDTNSFTQVVSHCAPGVLPALALRVHSDIGLLTTIGLATGGAMLRGRRHAWDDVFGRPRVRKTQAFRISGIALIGVGVVTWFVTGAAAWGVLGTCKTGHCATRARLMAFTTRDTGAVLVAAGGGMLGWAEAYRRNHERFTRDKALSIGPTLGAGRLGISISGRF